MQKLHLKKLVACSGAVGLTAVLGATLTGCGGGNGSGNLFVPTPTPIPAATTAFGAATAFGPGTLRSYITSRSGVPVEIGIEVSQAALNNPGALPQPKPGMLFTDEIRLQSPPGLTTQTPFLASAIYYSPGHPPAAEQFPHIHPVWYVVPDSVRFQILPGDPRNFVVPPANELPTGFITPPDPNAAYIPTLGTIYFDATEAGYVENPFTTALSEYRYFNGHMTLIALGVVNSFLKNKGSLERPLGTPAKYPKPGYYPTTYSVRYDETRKVGIMALGGFVHRN